MNTSEIPLGTAVEYRSTTGFKKLGIVLGTPATVEEGHSIPVPEEGSGHLEIHSLTGNTYLAANVPVVSRESLDLLDRGVALLQN